MRPWQNQGHFKHTLGWGVLNFVWGSGHKSVCRFSGGRGQPEVNAFHFKHTLGWGVLNFVGTEIFYTR